jgi:hypothetical protein
MYNNCSEYLIDVLDKLEMLFFAMHKLNINDKIINCKVTEIKY